MKLAEVIEHLEQLAPPALAEAWDNTGLLLGELSLEIHRVLTCLTLTPEVVEEAIEQQVQLVVAHHPLMFKPVQQITSRTTEGRTLWRLARAGIAVYSPHTAWDSAPQGINQQLAERFGLSDIAPLRPKSVDAGYKLITTLPASDLEQVQRALWQAGCGTIGNYRECSFFSPVTGTFRGDDSSQPTIGQAGQLEHVAELKLEVVCPKPRLGKAIAALRNAHSYEEPAIDVVPLEAVPSGQGAGRCGTLQTAMTLAEFVTSVKQQLDCPGLQFVGDPGKKVERLGIACGSAGEFWKDARRAGCQVLLTGETRFHTGLEVRDAGFALIVAGHDATERFAMLHLARLMMQHCPDIIATASTAESDPFRQ